MKMKILAAIAAGIFAIAATAGNAATTEIGTFVGSETITFDSLAPSATISNQFAGQGVTFGSGWRSISECSWHSMCTASEIFAQSIGSVVSLSFSSAQTKVGFELGSNINFNATIEILSGASVLDSFFYTQSHNFTSASRIFRGFENAAGFDGIRFTFSSGTHHINNLTFGEVAAVPLPASLPLLAFGIGGLGYMARRRRKAA